MKPKFQFGDRVMYCPKGLSESTIKIISNKPIIGTIIKTGSDMLYNNLYLVLWDNYIKTHHCDTELRLSRPQGYNDFEERIKDRMGLL